MTTTTVTTVTSRPSAAAGISLAATGPACLACGLPFLWPALAAVGLGTAVGVSHLLSWAIVPVLVVLLARNAGRHGDRRPLRLAVVGAAVYLGHVGAHFVVGTDSLLFLLTDHVGVGLLGAGALWDVAVSRRIRRAHASTVR